MKLRFELSRCNATIHYTPRREIHGENPEPAATVAIETTLPAELLAMFSPTLRWSLYEGEPPDSPRFPEIEGAIRWKKEIVGGLLIVHSVLGGVSDIRLPVAKADKFEIAVVEGGAFTLAFRVACHPAEAQHGALAMRQDMECEVSFEPPALDLVEQAEAGADKPLNTAGEAAPKRGRGSRRTRAVDE